MEKSTTFKDQMNNEFIPAIKRMIEKEKAHLESMKKVRPKMISKVQIDGFIYRSESDLNHYESRLQEYITFAQNL